MTPPTLTIMGMTLPSLIWLALAAVVVAVLAAFWVISDVLDGDLDGISGHATVVSLAVIVAIGFGLLGGWQP